MLPKLFNCAYLSDFDGMLMHTHNCRDDDAS
jgi:hypothetical protein